MESPTKDIESIVKEKMSILDGTAHSYSHVDRVLKIATLLTKQERADVRLVQIGAILHDIGRTVGEPHNETGAKLARKILTETGYSHEEIDKIAGIVLRHPLSFRAKLETLEEKIVWDADKIDLLGVAGFARIFHWYGKRPFEKVVKTCSEDLKPLCDSFNTLAARKIAKARRTKTICLLLDLERELSLKDLI